jgi:lysozyme family protein
MRYSDIWPRYAKYWDTMTINAGRVQQFTDEAQFAINNKITYQVLESKTRVPWQMLACIHRRESDANFKTYLGNGQSLTIRTTEVPVGRGPFTGPNAFVDGAVDAINVEGWGSIGDWRLEKQLYYMLLFNGVGSENWGHPSSYIWGGTNIQQPGKWIRDHVWSSTVMDPQPGCAPLLQMIAKLDPTVTFTRETA